MEKQVTLNVNKLTNLEFVQLLRDTVIDGEKIRAEAPPPTEEGTSNSLFETDTPLKRYFENLKAGIEPYQTAIKNPRKSPFTQTLEEKDTFRDRAYSQFGRKLSFFEWSDDPDQQKAYIDLDILWDIHRGSSRMNVKEQTAAIDNFLNDLNKEPYATALQTLGMTAERDRMKQTNDDYFDELARAREVEAATEVADTKAMRSELTDLYRDYAEYIYVLAKAYPDNEEWDKLHSTLNASRRRYRETLNRKFAGSENE